MTPPLTHYADGLLRAGRPGTGVQARLAAGPCSQLAIERFVGPADETHAHIAGRPERWFARLVKPPGRDTG